MTRWTAVALSLGAAILGAPCPAPACTLCRTSLQSTVTLRQDAAEAKIVVYGTLANPRLLKGDDSGGGATDLKIERVLKSDPFLGDRKVLEIPRYLPVDPKDPAKFLLFCEVYKGKLDPYRGVPVKSPAVVDYLKDALGLDAKDSAQRLLYFFRFLDHADPEVARDAFLEFAKASDADVGTVAPKLAPDKLRRLLTDPQTPSERLSLYAFLVGASGSDKEAELLRTLMRDDSPRIRENLSGFLAGYVRLQPAKGWALLFDILKDEKKLFTERYAALSALRFFRGMKPEETRREVLQGLGILLPQGDMADLAVEDLRRWQVWDLTNDVLAQYGKKTHDAPIVRRTIIRYALTCPRPEAARFIGERRKEDPELVRDVEESLQFEKKK